MRVLHTMIRVTDLEKSLNFYTNILGMKLLRRHEYPDGKFTLAFVGFGDEKDHAVIELTYNWGACFNIFIISKTSALPSTLLKIYSNTFINNFFNITRYQ